MTDNGGTSEGVDAVVRFRELFNLDEIQHMQDSYAQATGVACLITAPDGRPLTRASNFNHLCFSLIRETDEGLNRCMASDALLGSASDDGPSFQRCLSAGLYDGGTKIIVDGHHVANWLIGQVLEEKDDLDTLAAYADVIGVDRGEYRKALEGVTRIPLARFQAICDFLQLYVRQMVRQALRHEHLTREVEYAMMSEERFRHLSYHDSLTGLYNRRFFEEEMNRMNVPRNLPLTLIMGDLNGLKLINDAFGHEKGDEYLCKAANAIRKTCRRDDVITRWGGDEFVILMPETDEQAAEEITRRIKQELSSEEVNAVRVSISFGWQTKRTEDENIASLLGIAEDYMYKHKIIENEHLRGSTIQTIISTLHEKNPREEQHSKRVSEVCQRIGQAMSLNSLEMGRLKVVGLLHDIGKIAIDEGILNKPGRLTNAELAEIRRHPDIGFRILSTAPEMKELAEAIHAHHERWDGTGYPKGLKGVDIPRVARIIAIADAYDAMTSERPYRAALTDEQAHEEIRRFSGIQFDPELALLFVEQVREAGD